MIRTGTLWRELEMRQQPGYSFFRLSGKGSIEYFQSYSTRAIESLQADAALEPRPGDVIDPSPPRHIAKTTDPWAIAMRQAFENALNQYHLTHYTSRDKLPLIFPQMRQGAPGKLVSTLTLDKQGLFDTDPRVTSNAESVDIAYLGNTDFVFFFLERPDTGMRPTRFGEVRISLPVSLISEYDGALMLNDFMAREMPTIRADTHGNLHSYVREEKGFPESMAKLPVKSPEGKMAVSAEKRTEMLQQLEELEPLLEEGRQGGWPQNILEDMEQSVLDLRAQLEESAVSGAYATADSKRYSYRVRKLVAPSHSDTSTRYAEMLTYKVSAQTSGSAPAQVPRTRHAEHLAHNLFVGGDVIRGLALRCVVELIRLRNVNPQIFDRFQRLGVDGMLDELLHRFNRPQVMLPRWVQIMPHQLDSDSRRHFIP